MQRDSKITIIEGVFNSLLSYCLPVFGGCSKAELELLQVQQNKAAQIALNCPPRTNRDFMYDKLGWLTIEHLIAYHSLIAVFGIRMSKAPEYLAKQLTRENRQWRKYCVLETLFHLNKINLQFKPTFEP